ncbi:MAG TPA: energy transducer TonB, partial [Usitatibacter sp.]
LDRAPDPLPPVRAANRAEGAAVIPSSSPESDPLFSMAEVSPPRVRSSDGVPLYLLDHPGQDTLFVEAVVASDGSVSAVTVIGGDSKLARHVVDAMRRERYEPARFRGRPVAVSIYRLISRMEVWGT